MTEIKKKFGAGLECILEQKNINQTKLAKRCGMSTSSFTDYKKGRRGKEEVRTLIANEPGWNYQDMLDLGEWLLNGGSFVDFKKGDNATFLPEAQPVSRKIPLISFVQAGDWHDAVDNFHPGDAEEWVTASPNLGPRSFSLRVNGKSMEPEFREGEYINVDPDAQVNSGDYIIAKNGDEEATFKQYYKDGNRHLLVPLNKDWRKPIDMTGKDWHIVGRVMEKVKRY